MSKSPGYELHRLIEDMPSETYHSISGTHSSSQLKDLLDDEDVFFKKHIEKSIEKLSIPAFDLGSYFHTGILEPHKLKDETIVYPGKIRSGKAWDIFKQKHKNKAIITQSQKSQAEGLIKAVEESPIAMGFVEKSKKEISLFTDIQIARGEIYAPKFKKRLTRYGWETVKIPALLSAVKLVIKVRADGLGDSFILDLKSTTGNARSEISMRKKISDYQYDLSAALYLDMFSLVSKNPLKNFIWIFASKDMFNSKSYRASENNILVGRAKYMKALFKLAECIRNKWQKYDSLGELEPLPYELEYLKEKETDLV